MKQYKPSGYDEAPPIVREELIDMLSDILIALSTKNYRETGHWEDPMAINSRVFSGRKYRISRKDGFVRAEFEDGEVLEVLVEL